MNKIKIFLFSLILIMIMLSLVACGQPKSEQTLFNIDASNVYYLEIFKEGENHATITDKDLISGIVEKINSITYITKGRVNIEEKSYRVTLYGHDSIAICQFIPFDDCIDYRDVRYYGGNTEFGYFEEVYAQNQKE